MLLRTPQRFLAAGVMCYFKGDPVLDKLETKNEPN